MGTKTPGLREIKVISMLRNVLIPVGLSEEDELVVDFAKGLYESGARRLIIAHTVDASGMEGPIIARAIDKALLELRKVASRLPASGMDVELRIATGDPVAEMVALAAEAGIDSVVCGTHAKDLLTKLIAGSVSEQIALEATVPTMLIRYDLLRDRAEPSELASAFGRRVLIPTDFTPSATRAFITATAMEKGLLEAVHIVHVITEALEPEAMAEAQQEAYSRVEGLVRTASGSGIEVSAVVMHGDPVDVILGQAKKTGATGIMLGRKDAGPLRAISVSPGATAMGLISGAECPVVFVP